MRVVGVQHRAILSASARTSNYGRYIDLNARWLETDGSEQLDEIRIFEP
jgi:hypothetical protein